MEVAVQEPVAVGKRVEAREGTRARVVRDERRPEPVPQLVAKVRQPGRRRDPVRPSSQAKTSASRPAPSSSRSPVDTAFRS